MTPFEQLLSDPYAARYYLVELSPYDPATGGLVDLYYSGHGFTTEPGDTPPNQHYEARVQEALNFQRSLFQPGAIGGASIPDFGEIRLDNSDGELDFLRRLAFDGRRVVVRLGGKDFAYADYGVVFSGTAQSAVADEQQVAIRLRDLQYKLDTPIRTEHYREHESDALDLVFGLAPAPAGGNAYHYVQLPKIDPYTLQAGDVLEYGVLWSELGPAPQRIAVDLETSAGALRATAAVDQNGLSCHPSTDLTAHARGEWYQRRIPIPAALVGAEAGVFSLACGHNTPETPPPGFVLSRVRGAVTDVVLTDGAGTIRHSVWQAGEDVPAFATHLTSDPANTLTVELLLDRDGDPNLAGKPKPLCFGQCLNVTPAFVSPSQLVYQVHAGPIQAIDAVYDSGVELNPPSDPTNPQYTVDLERGTLTLEQAPTGEGTLITADVRGDATDGIYVETVAGVVQRLVTAYGPLTDSELDAATLDALDAENGETVGLYLSDQRDVLAALDELINTVGGFYGFNRAGLFCVGRVEEPDRWPAVVLDGVDDRIAVAGLFYDGEDYDALTVEAWVLAEPPGGTLASWDRSEYWRFSVESGGEVSLRYFDAENAVIQDLVGQTSVLDGRWHHLAAVLGGGQLVLYVDGAVDATFAVGQTFGKEGVARYGFWGSGSEAVDESGTAHHATYFKGKVAEGRIWHVARGQSEIAADMDRRLTGDEPGLLGYWRFDEGAGGSAADATGNLYHGTLAGAAWNVSATLSEAEILEIETEATELPLWRQRVSYQRNWTVQNADSLAGAVPEDRRAFLTEETRVATARDPGIQERHLLARDPEPAAGLFDAQSAATAEAERLLALYGVRRDVYRVTVKTQPYRLELDDQVQLVYPRFGLEGGRVFRVIGLEEIAEVNRVTLELWG